ncbi:hypothetical protein MTAB308_4179 [Mycobacterium terramassiliense]|uniref:Uncharacterized protein n=2 Tax=Mycobacterium terramassiliense TaxID=1841859 RepID=A0A2U3NGR0_9MYCO|nr:hypothetical protein MTAB308_4179 [Mycobacterium terramassiliense]
MLHDPHSGNWLKVTHTADGTTRTTDDNPEHEKTVTEHYRVYSGDGGEEIDSRLVTGLVDRQVRE